MPKTESTAVDWRQSIRVARPARLPETDVANKSEGMILSLPTRVSITLRCSLAGSQRSLNHDPRRRQPDAITAAENCSPVRRDRIWRRRRRRYVTATGRAAYIRGRRWLSWRPLPMTSPGQQQQQQGGHRSKDSECSLYTSTRPLTETRPTRPLSQCKQ